MIQNREQLEYISQVVKTPEAFNKLFFLYLSDNDFSVTQMREFMLENKKYLNDLVNYKEHIAGNSISQEKIDLADQLISEAPVKHLNIVHSKAKAMMDNGNVVILDARTEAEFAEMHITDAVLIPNTDINDIAPKLLTDKNKIILVYSNTGKRSEKASRALAELGYTRLYYFGGIANWPYGTVTN